MPMLSVPHCGATTRLVLTSLALGIAPWAAAQAPGGLSEQDFLTDMPMVLSVSRLPQRLDETPGAVTLLDRDMIRRSGARDLADLLRLVPGFQSNASFEGVAPVASYHGGFDAFSNRMQVLIDGRSAYSPYFIGTVGPGLQTVALQDIERIEVLRGSNSAAYGARAVLGIVNIVTRHTLDTLGTQVSTAIGQNGVLDAQARIGWGREGASFRLTADRSADDGLAGAFGHSRVERVNFRSDFNPSAMDEVQVRVGGLSVLSGRGLTRFDGAPEAGNPPRESTFGTSYAQVDWRRNLGDDQDVAMTLSHTQEVYQDSFQYPLQLLNPKNRPPLFGPNDFYVVGVGGKASNQTASWQHTLRQGPNLRVVWGGELRREQVSSEPLYNTTADFQTDFKRLFANAEWRMQPQLVLNAGAMVERISASGDSSSHVAPRVMLNWHMAPGHTVRAGVSRAQRPPSTFENHADVRYTLNGRVLAQSVLASGNLRPETVWAKELGYLLDAPQQGLGLDVRVFHERLDGYIIQLNENSVPRRVIKDYANTDGFDIRGLEYQLKWQPWRGTELNFNQTYIDLVTANPSVKYVAPKLATTVALFQRLPNGIDLALLHQQSTDVRLFAGSAGTENPRRRTDMRVAKPVQVGGHRGDLALVVQNLGSPQQVHRPSFWFERRAFVTLTLSN